MVYTQIFRRLKGYKLRSVYVKHPKLQFIHFIVRAIIRIRSKLRQINIPLHCTTGPYQLHCGATFPHCRIEPR